MSLPNPANPQCPDCGKPSRRKRTNQDGRKIYDCACGWSNTVKRIPRSLLKKKELDKLAYQFAIEHLKQSACIGSFIDLSETIGGERWLYSCDELRKDLKKLIKDGKQC